MCIQHAMQQFLIDEDYSIDALIPRVVGLLTRVCDANVEKLAAGKTKPSLFDCTRIPPIGIHSYLLRLVRQGRFSATSLLVMVIFTDRLFQCSQIDFTYKNVHRIMLTSLVLATKAYSDAYYTNKYYAAVGGVTLKDLNALESFFLECVDWRLQVDNDFFKYKTHIMRCSVAATAAAAAPAADHCAAGSGAAAAAAALRAQQQPMMATATPPPQPASATATNSAVQHLPAPPALKKPCYPPPAAPLGAHQRMSQHQHIAAQAAVPQTQQAGGVCVAAPMPPQASTPPSPSDASSSTARSTPTDEVLVSCNSFTSYNCFDRSALGATATDQAARMTRALSLPPLALRKTMKEVATTSA